MADTVSISAATAEGLTGIGIGDFYPVMQAETMAWAVLVLRRLPDRPEWFPRGKWATIQHIETEVGKCADSVAALVTDREH